MTGERPTSGAAASEVPLALPVHVRVRRDRILALVRGRDLVRVGELADRLGVSSVTVRGDRRRPTFVPAATVPGGSAT